MINVPYLLKCLDTEVLDELVANIDTPPLDMNLAIWDAIDNKEIEVNEDEKFEVDGKEYTGRVKLLVDPKPSSDPDLKNKILRTIQHYSRDEVNISRGRLNSQIKDMSTGKGYGWHDYIMAVQHLIDEGTVVQHVIDVPAVTKEKISKTGKRKVKVVRPAHKFAFLGLAENEDKNEEWNAIAVNKWIADMEQHMVR